MFKRFVPYCHAKTIYEIEPTFFKKQNVSVLFIDLDNTLDSFRAKRAKEDSIKYLNSLKNEGITPIIVSNNKKSRVEGFAKDCDVNFVFSAKKPSGKKLVKEISKKGCGKENIMLVGDQLMTDVLAAKNAKIRVLLTEKLVKEDQWTTHINRLIDRPIRHYLRKNGKLIDWREI